MNICSLWWNIIYSYPEFAGDRTIGWHEVRVLREFEVDWRVCVVVRATEYLSGKTDNYLIIYSALKQMKWNAQWTIGPNLYIN